MPKYLIEASYTLEGVKTIKSSGGTSRRDAAAEVAESVGGRLENLYFAFGDHDVYVIVDFRTTRALRPLLLPCERWCC